MQDTHVIKVRRDSSLVDFSGFIHALDASGQRLKDQINGVVDAHMLDLADAITLTEMLTKIGTAVVASTGDPRTIEVTVRFK